MKLAVEARSNAPLEILYATHMDIAHWPDFIRGIEKVEILGGGEPIGVGTTVRETRMMYGRLATEDMTVQILEPPHRVVFTAASHGAAYVTTTEFVADGNGSRVILGFEGRAQTLFARVMSLLSLFFIPGIRKMLQADADDLVREAERRASTGAARAASP